MYIYTDVIVTYKRLHDNVDRQCRAACRIIFYFIKNTLSPYFTFISWSRNINWERKNCDLWPKGGQRFSILGSWNKILIAAVKSIHINLNLAHNMRQIWYTQQNNVRIANVSIASMTSTGTRFNKFSMGFSVLGSVMYVIKSLV